jgi:hypothetical protein
MIIYTQSPSFSELHKYLQLRNSNSNIFKVNHNNAFINCQCNNALSLRMSPHKCYCKQQVIQITTIVIVIIGVIMSKITTEWSNDVTIYKSASQESVWINCICIF